MKNEVFNLGVGLLLLAGCHAINRPVMNLIPPSANFQRILNGKHTDLFVLHNDRGMYVAVTNYGARLVSLVCPDADGTPVDVVTGYDSLEGYIHAVEPDAWAKLGDVGEYSLQHKVWNTAKLGDGVLVLSYRSADGEDGLPGNLWVKVVYSLTEANELRIDHYAAASQPRVFEGLSSVFFNLNGSGSIMNHLLMINANKVVWPHSKMMPGAKLVGVEGSPFDFRIRERIGGWIDAVTSQSGSSGGYDHLYVLNKNKVKPAALVLGDQTGIKMKVFTRDQGLLFYSGNLMRGKNKMRNGPDDFRTAFCLEPRHFSGISAEVCCPGEVYSSGVVYQFSN